MSDNDGKIDIELNGRYHKLLCNWRAIEDIQTELGIGFVPLARLMAAKRHGLREVAVIVRHGLIAAGASPEPKYEKVAEEVFKTGLLNPQLIASVMLFCEYGLNGGRPGGGKDDGGKPPAAA